MSNDTKVTPFLLFQDKNAEEAMRFYVSLFEDGRVVSAELYGADGPGGPEAEGTLSRGVFEIAGQTVLCTDSPSVHAFSFTPSVSLFVDCVSEEELDKLANALGERGAVLMPLDNYGFSKKFTWLQDRYGVSWQLNLP